MRTSFEFKGPIFCQIHSFSNDNLYLYPVGELLSNKKISSFTPLLLLAKTHVLEIGPL